MKTLLAAIVALACVLPLRADDEALQNGDFSDGIIHWHGDGRSPADFASDNPLQAADALTAKGLILPLKHTLWTKEEQDFRTHFTSGVLRITYKVSPDFALSSDLSDYANPSAALGWGWAIFKTPPGSWLIFFSSQGGTHGHYYVVQPKTGTGDVQTYAVKVGAMVAGDDQTITIAMPPGSGTIVFLSASLNDQ